MAAALTTRVGSIRSNSASILQRSVISISALVADTVWENSSSRRQEPAHHSVGPDHQRPYFEFPPGHGVLSCYRPRDWRKSRIFPSPLKSMVKKDLPPGVAGKTQVVTDLEGAALVGVTDHIALMLQMFGLKVVVPGGFQGETSVGAQISPLAAQEAAFGP